MRYQTAPHPEVRVIVTLYGGLVTTTFLNEKPLYPVRELNSRYKAENLASYH